MFRFARWGHTGDKGDLAVNISVFDYNRWTIIVAVGFTLSRHPYDLFCLFMDPFVVRTYSQESKRGLPRSSW